MFLLAVRDYGRDWKKIEEYVVTRSSTQARSHAQKVLKGVNDEKLNTEINRLAKVYSKVPRFEQASSKSSSTKSNSRTSKKASKGKNKKKKNINGDIENLDGNENIQKSSSGSIKSDRENQSVSNYEYYSEYSDYSYPDDPNTKLFIIERTKKKRKNLRKRKARNVSKIMEPKETKLRKTSVVTNGSRRTTNINSPTKTIASKNSSPEPKIQKLTNQDDDKQEEGLNLKKSSKDG